MSDNLLDKLNSRIQEDILNKKRSVEEAREATGYTSHEEYFYNKLQDKIVKALCIEDINLEFIDRKMFGADVAIKIPGLLKEKGAGVYIKEVVPVLVANLQKLASPDGDFANVEHKGIYVNILLNNKYLFENIWQVVKMGTNFGQSDLFKKRSVVVDYSSPNVAKHLHAGHIRSTIIGEVLCNIYEAVGYTVHRLNYINDWGGMGYLIEGYERWGQAKSNNDELYNIYQIYRRGEKLAGSEADFNLLTPEVADELASYYGIFSSFSEFKERFEDFKNSANSRFKNLEAGAEMEFALWSKMREWSLEEFDKFYGAMGIKHDYTVGESFYAKRAKDLVEDRLSTGEVVLFTDSLAESEINHLKGLLEVGELTEARFKQLCDEVRDDIGACFVILDNHKRLLVKKSNGATLYAVRDLAGIEHRIDTFRPARLIYETAEEQIEYFKELFEATHVLNLDHNREVTLTHLAHGFYVDTETGKKLASREGAESVGNLITESTKYFRVKYDKREGDLYHLSSEEKDANSAKLAVGSITFNDIKQDKRFAISLDRDTQKSIKNFEESGGAYIMYSLARARSIMRKAGVNPAEAIVGVEDFKDMTEDEIAISKRLGQLPNVILRSAVEDNPATLANYLLTLANDYNGYYERSKVLEDGKLPYPHRLLITSAVAQVLANGLKICHAEAPEVI
ncbi:MAG: arginine--tRNA ligase [bacterium]|nr:arginine--tRNA ligase [bacterium]